MSFVAGGGSLVEIIGGSVLVISIGIDVGAMAVVMGFVAT